MLPNALRFAHELLTNSIAPGETVIDATVGNGKDTILLAKLVGKTGMVIGFDIQKEAIERAKEKLLLTGLLGQTSLHQLGHEHVDQVLPENKQIGAALFNLGYLPAGNKSVTTKAQTTMSAVKKIMPHVRKGGLITIMVYPGHDEGKNEENELLAWTPTIPQKEFNVLHYSFLNQVNDPPFLIVLEKR